MWHHGKTVIIKRPDPVHGMLGFKENILGVMGRVLSASFEMPDGYLVEFKHPLSHRVVSAVLTGKMLEAFDAQYDEIKYTTKAWKVQFWVLREGKEIAQGSVTGKGDPVKPFPMWPEITVRMFDFEHPEILTTGRLCKLSRV
jgi:hypothetical protein